MSCHLMLIHSVEGNAVCTSLFVCVCVCLVFITRTDGTLFALWRIMLSMDLRMILSLHQQMFMAEPTSLIHDMVINFFEAVQAEN
jgi:hypothetical protein